MFNAMVELLDDLCLSMEELEDSGRLADQVDQIDEDLGTLEEGLLRSGRRCGCHAMEMGTGCVLK